MTTGHTAIRHQLASLLSAKALALVVSIGHDLALAPLLIHAWGGGRYETWITLATAAHLAALLDFGVQAHFASRLTLSWNAGDRSQFTRTATVFLSVQTGLGLGAVAVGSAAVIVLAPVDTMTALVLVIWAATRMPMAVPAAALAAAGRQERATWAGAGEAVLRLVLTVGGLMLGAGFQTIALLWVSSAAAAAIWLWLDTRWLGDGPLSLCRPTKAEVKRAWRQGWLYGIGTAAVAALTQGPVLLLAALATQPLAVLAFTTARTTVGLGRQAALQFAQAIAVEQARAWAAGDEERLRRYRLFAVRLAAATAGGVGGLVWIIAADWLRIWTLGAAPFNPMIFGLLIVAAMVAAPAYAAAYLLHQTDRPMAQAVALGGAGVAALGLGALLIPIWGGAGMALALGVAEPAAVILGPARLAVRNPKERRELALAALIAGGGACALGAGVAGTADALIGGGPVLHLLAVMACWGGGVGIPGALTFGIGRIGPFRHRLRTEKTG